LSLPLIASVFPSAVRAPRLRLQLVTADAIVPGPTGSGNSAIRWGLLKGLQQVGADVGLFAANVPERRLADFAAAERALALGPGKFGYRQSGEADGKALAEFMARFRPDVVLAYGTEPLRLVKRAGFTGPAGVMSVDLEFVPLLHRHLYNLRFGCLKQKAKSALLTPKIAGDFLQTYRELISGYALADFVINHAAHHACWHERRHGKPVLYTPNPLDAIYHGSPPRNPSSPPRFGLVGGIGGIATLTGLAWFAAKVYPLLEPALARGEMEIHLIGKGKLDSMPDRKMTRVIRRGFVEDLTGEFAAMSAMLVPTPISLGFRTRIVDAFRHGVTVVAHVSNCAGFPELMHDANAVVAATPEEFAAGVAALAADPGRAERLGSSALDQFRSELSATIAAEKILAFINSQIS